MTDGDKTKAQLIREHAALRKRVAGLETSETRCRRAEEARRRYSHALRERVKELNCLYGISRLVDTPGISLEEILQGVVDLIAPAWQYPEITCARLFLKDREFRTENFEESEWKQSSDIFVQGKPVGALEVCYLKQRPESDEGPFVKDERLLIDGIAERLGRIIERKQAKNSLQESENRYRTLFDNVSDAIFIHDLSGHFLEVNQVACERLGYHREELLQMTPMDIDTPEYAALVPARVKELRQRGHVFFETAHVRRDGTTIPIELSSRIIEYAGKPAVLSVARDITERKRAERAARKSEERYRTLFEQSRDPIYITTRDGRIVEANQALSVLFGYTRDEIAEMNAAELYADPADRKIFQQEVERKGAVRDHEVKLRAKDGTEMDCLLTSNVRCTDEGSIVGYQGIIRDITQQKRAAETIKHLAFHDPLTGLPNRTLFNDRLRMALAEARRHQQHLAVMLMDLDRFKNVNDTLGHSSGDQLLQAVSARLATLLRETDTVCRMGGDEFLLLLTEIDRPDDADQVAEKILRSLRIPFVLDGHELSITSSLGIAVYPADGEDVDTLLKNADIAMYHAKAEGRDNYKRYTSPHVHKTSPILRRDAR